MKIYTGTGDKGETSLYTGQRVRKDCPYMCAVGDVDECNSMIGLALSHLEGERVLSEQLILIQHSLFDAGAAIATPRSRASEHKISKTRVNAEFCSQLEAWIDTMQDQLPALQNFILPGGHPCGAALHVARGICRRAERSIIGLHDAGDVSDTLLRLLNRLSDYLFVAARWINHQLGQPETKWRD